MGESGNKKWRRKNQKTKAEWKAEMERAVGHRSRNQGKRTKDIVMNDIEKRIDEKAAAAKAAAARAGSASEASDGSEAAGQMPTPATMTTNHLHRVVPK